MIFLLTLPLALLHNLFVYISNLCADISQDIGKLIDYLERDYVD